MKDPFILYTLIAAAVLACVYFAASLARSWRHSRARRGSRVTRFGDNVHLRDLYRVAVLIEEDGHAFYLKMAGKASDPDSRDLCLALAAEELRHRDLVNGQLAQWRELAPHAAQWPVFVEKVRAEGFFAEPPGEDAPVKELAAYAIRQEIKSAEFYKLFEDAFPDAWKRAQIHRLVEEELRHEAKLRAAFPGAA
jgi:rubrerythrin